MFPLYDENPRSSRPYINYMLIAANFVVFLWEVAVTGFFSSERATLSLFMNYGFVPAKFLDTFDFLPILSSMFMHGGIMHILGNMLFLWIFGDNIEDRFGHGRYLAFYLFSGFIASMAHLGWAMGAGGQQLQIPAVGASGAVSGVLGAYLLLFPHARIVTMVFYFFMRMTRIPAYAYLVIWFIFQVISAGFTIGGGVAYVAHIGGFAIGAAIGFGYKSVSKLRLRAGTPAEKPSERVTEKPTAVGRQRMVRPMMEGIVTNSYVELIAEMPGVRERDIGLSVYDNAIHIDAISEDGYKRYTGKAIPRVRIQPAPESMQYLNGILRARFRRV